MGLSGRQPPLWLDGSDLPRTRNSAPAIPAIPSTIRTRRMKFMLPFRVDYLIGYASKVTELSVNISPGTGRSNDLVNLSLLTSIAAAVTPNIKFTAAKCRDGMLV